MSELTSLSEIAERAEKLVAISAADATSIAWLESREGEAVESARSRRAGVETRRSVLFRVRVGGRTGRARAESALPGDLQRSLRSALADARCNEPSPDWHLEAATREPAALSGLADPGVSALDPAAVQGDLQARAERRSTLRLRWREARLAVASSFHPVRATTLTDATFEARTGRRPGSGFAARSSRRIADLAFDPLIARARSLEAPEIDLSVSEDVPVVVLAPEAAAMLLDAVARRALAGGRRLAGGKAPDLRLAAVLRLVDEPLDPTGLPMPFDLDGCAKRPRVFVEKGWVVGVAADLDLAARLGLEPTAHALAGDDAWPDHLALEPGLAAESDLLAASAGGLRIGALEDLAIEPGEAMPFRTVARNVRRIGEGGELGAGLAPLSWSGTLRDLFAEVGGIGRETICWSPRSGSTGAVRCAALQLGRPGRFTPRPR